MGAVPWLILTGTVPHRARSLHARRLRQYGSVIRSAAEHSVRARLIGMGGAVLILMGAVPHGALCARRLRQYGSLIRSTAEHSARRLILTGTVPWVSLNACAQNYDLWNPNSI